jgi:hypothetical protein
LEFRVIWEIEIEAGSPEDAAQQARAAQLRPESSATVFGVWEYAEEVSAMLIFLDREEVLSKTKRRGLPRSG